ncbi:MAG: JAB domain-containing protein [Bacteroidales bacterium]|nr:JAB domain-containing protein [Bacteroidales bacterium]
MYLYGSDGKCRWRPDVNRIPASERKTIRRSQDAYEIFRLLWQDGTDHVESFGVLLLNRANKCLGFKWVSKGGTSGTVVDPKIVFQTALLAHASGIILCHNHPSGNTIPSDADTKITRKIKDCGLLLDVAVLDHIIVGDDRFYSFSDEGCL